MSSGEIKPPILVTGVPHTGTTMIAEIIKQLGVFIGDWGAKTNEDTSVGNEWKIYVKAGLQIFGRLRLNHKLEMDKLNFPDYKDIEQYYYCLPLPDVIEPGQTWGMKVPNITTLLPAYLKRFPEATLIYCSRNKKNNIRSLIKRNSFSEEYAKKYIDIIDQRFRGAADYYQRRYHEVKFENILDDPVETTRQLCSFLHINFNKEIISWLKNYIRK